MKNLLLIFYRNPELGKVKTRLAKTVGDEKALAIYLKLSDHTKTIAESLSVDRAVYYSYVTNDKDLWPNHLFQKQVQRGNDLGEKMYNAFVAGFANGYQSICIIGTDCLELTTKIIADAFEQLENHNAVIGPAKDGGYYLLGMKKLYPEFFLNKTWSTDSVYGDTINDFKKLKLNYAVLPILTDVDEEKDLPIGFLI